MPTFPEQLRARRLAAGMSLADLSTRTGYDRTYFAHAESGRRTATEPFAAAVDVALNADGELYKAWEKEDAIRRRDAATHRTRAAALAISRDLCAMADLDISELHAGVEATAVDYLGTPPAPMMDRAHALRAAAAERIRSGHHRPQDRSDLYVTAGQLSGVLAYALLDMGDPQEALHHVAAAARCAEYAGDAELAAWVAGTRSLICRFMGDYGLALDAIRDGYQHVGSGTGTGEARLRCGEAQCLANLGDSQAANAALDGAEDARGRIRRPDSLGGLFGFSAAKQSYYAGSSLIWLDGGHDAERAAREATAAIGMWQAGPEDERSLDDERLAHVYLATARVQLGDVEGAAEAIGPILSLPLEEQISWIIKRADRLASMLSAPRFQGNRTAEETVQAIKELAA
ncbi:helix-turn-helix protein [Streptomyces sp. 2321.6]|uniref:helix-turn-helix domain-containing protein n=2 Tax=Streptomyces TaxID=1883 RepID=UPI000B7177DB|nr:MULTISPECIES: helix-turn-helix transcriptional regulator [unclassified Streptomyces]PBC72278.1 helix-turn-helix protein [Streptomyces sp. 2321.6]SNC77782.1 Helix-turn-helix domain-containing protein [Streptomyces sp. 2114.4]